MISSVISSIDSSVPYYKAATIEEKLISLEKGIACLQRSRQSLPISFKAQETRYQLEAGTRLIAAKLFIEIGEYEKAKAHLHAVQLFKGSFDGSENDFAVARALLEKIDDLSNKTFVDKIRITTNESVRISEDRIV